MSATTPTSTSEETTVNEITVTELAQRQNDGLEVTLLWARADNSIRVAIKNVRTGLAFGFPVAGADALDAFYHPFAYAA